MRYRGKYKTKHEHGMIPGLGRFLEKEMEPLEYVHSIIPGEIKRIRSHIPGIQVRFQYSTTTGAKLIAYVSGAAQEIFVVTDKPKELEKMLKKRFRK